MEIREFIDSDGKPINSEILDMNRQYETLRDALQLADQKEREEAKGNKNETEQKEISEKAATRKKLLEKLEESMSPTKLQSDSKNDDLSSLIKDLERIAQFDASRSEEEKKVLRGDLSFFDELEALDDHRLATEQAYTILNQRERELEDQLHSKKKSALVSSSAQRSFPVSAAVTNESNGWKKGFLGKKSTTPLVASTIIHADVASVSTTTQNDSSIVTMSSSTSSSAPPAQAIKAPALAKSRAVKDVVIERFP